MMAIEKWNISKFPEKNTLFVLERSKIEEIAHPADYSYLPPWISVHVISNIQLIHTVKNVTRSEPKCHLFFFPLYVSYCISNVEHCWASVYLMEWKW